MTEQKNMQDTHARERIKFTRKMKKEYTILSPMLAPIHFAILKPMLERQGFHVELMENEGPDVIQKGLKYVQNDICYPALLITGQMLATMESGKYDPDKVAMVITQSGGGCRDSNYIHLMRKAFERAGYPNVPFISANSWGMELNPGIDLSLPTMLMAAAGLVYGDMIMITSNQIRPYEIHKGDTDAMLDKWIKQLGDDFSHARNYMPGSIKKTLRRIADDFASIPIKKVPKVKVAVLGELYLKYSAVGNNHLEEFLAEQDCEVFMPSMLSFGAYKTGGALEDLRLYGGKPFKKLVMEIVMKGFYMYENLLVTALEEHPSFVGFERISQLKKRTAGLIDVGNSMGEGWYITGEALEMIEKGYENIICVQPFGCLPSHVCIKGMLNSIRREDGRANPVVIEYDAGATKVNQENRIKLMLAVAKEHLDEM